MSGFITNFLENRDGAFPLLTAHEWARLGYDKITEAMTMHLKYTNFAVYRLGIAQGYSVKRKELLIAYKEASTFIKEKRPEIIKSKLIANGYHISDDANVEQVFESIIETIELDGIKIKAGKAIAAGIQLEKVDKDTITKIYAYNTVIAAMDDAEKNRFNDREADRLKAGLPLCTGELRDAYN